MVIRWFPLVGTVAENVRLAGNTVPDAETEQKSTLPVTPGLAIMPSMLARTYAAKPKAEQDAL